MAKNLHFTHPLAILCTKPKKPLSGYYGITGTVLQGSHGGTAIAAEVAQNERTVHTKFFNGKSGNIIICYHYDSIIDFDDLFNDEDLD